MPDAQSELGTDAETHGLADDAAYFANCDAHAKSYAHAFSLADTSSLPCSLDIIAVTRPYENADEDAHKSPLSFPNFKSFAKSIEASDVFADFESCADGPSPPFSPSPRLVRLGNDRARRR